MCFGCHVINFIILFFILHAGCKDDFEDSAALLTGKYPPPVPMPSMSTLAFLERKVRIMPTGDFVPCFHTGDGIFVRESDFNKLEAELVRLFNAGEFALSEMAVNILIRMHWPGQTFARLQRIRGSKDPLQPPFHEGRYQSCFG